MLVPWFDVDGAFADLTAFGRQMDAMLAGRTDPPTAGAFTRDADGAYVLTADLPGVAKEDVAIAVEDGLQRPGGSPWILTIKASRAASAPDGFTSRYTERRAIGIDRAFHLSDDIDVDGITANVEHGVLTVRVPVRAPERRRIGVASA